MTTQTARRAKPRQIWRRCSLKSDDCSSGALACIPNGDEQKHARDDARHRDKKTDANVKGLPPQEFREDRATQFQLPKLVLGFDDFGEIADRGVARDDEVLAAALGVARNEHRQQAYVHDEEG